MNLLFFFSKWHNFAVKYFKYLNILIILLLFASAYKLRNLKIDGDWLSIFSKNDPVYIDYQKYFKNDSNLQNIFVVSRINKINTSDIISQALCSIELVKSAKILLKKNEKVWFNIKLSSEAIKNLDSQKKVLNIIKSKLKLKQIQFRITGPIEIINEFNEKLQVDFIKTSSIALAFIVTLMIFFYGLIPIVLYGFYIEIVGFVIGLFLYQLFYDSLNILAVTLPCVLFGLGIDFVIHSLTSSFEKEKGYQDDKGMLIYQNVAVPMFWGAITTAIAFLSLCFTDLAGLRPAGFLGALVLIIMYFSVIFMLPPALSVFRNSKRKIISTIKIPFTNALSKKYIRYTLLLAIIIALCFIHKVSFEDNVKKLYDPAMSSLKVQEELVSDIGMHMSLLFVEFQTKNPLKDIKAVSRVNNFYYLLGKPETKGGVISFKIGAVKDPFDRNNYQELKNKIKEKVSNLAKNSLKLIGDPSICNNMNTLLFKGVAQAIIVLTIFIFIILLFIYRKFSYAFAVVGVLLLTVLVTLGFFGFFDIRLNLYTIILFPLFLGMGVDDCLHIIYYIDKNSLEPNANDAVLKSIILTTLTTLLGYASLLFVGNQGFKSMGLAAFLGLTLSCLLGIYVLPLMLKNKISLKNIPSKVKF